MNSCVYCVFEFAGLDGDRSQHEHATRQKFGHTWVILCVTEMSFMTIQTVFMYEFPWFEEDSEERASWSASMRESSSNMRVFICDTCVMFCYLCFYYYWNQQVYPIFRQVVRLNTQSDPADKSSKHNTHTHTHAQSHTNSSHKDSLRQSIVNSSLNPAVDRLETAALWLLWEVVNGTRRIWQRVHMLIRAYLIALIKVITSSTSPWQQHTTKKSSLWSMDDNSRPQYDA